MKRTAFALLAGGFGSRMMNLRVPKPLVPFGGAARLIDFSVQNVRRSGGRKLVVMLKSHREAIVDALLGAYPPSPEFSLDFGPWNDVYVGDRSRVLSRPGPLEELGTADALVTHKRQLVDAGVRDVFILHSDHVYEFDYREMLLFHRDNDAVLTIGYQTVEEQYVKLFGMVKFDAEGRLTQFVEKPETVTSNAVFTAVGVFRVDVLFEVIEALFVRPWSHDISRDVIPAMLARGDRIVGFPFRRYWADVGTLERYHQSQMAFVFEGAGPDLEAMEPTFERCVKDQKTRSFIAPSAEVRGRVERSIVYAGAHVSRGAHVQRSIVLPGATVEGTVCDTIVRPGESVVDRRGLAGLAAE